MASVTRPSLPKRGSTPDELDPVEASSTPITPDPRTRARKPTQPRVNYSPGSADPAAIDAARRMFIAGGIDAETAQAMAEQQVLDNKQGVLDQMDAPGDARKARQAQASAANHQRMIDSGHVPTTNPDGSVSYQLAPDMEPRTAAELQGMGLNGYAEPGPSMPDGSRVTRPRAFTTERASRAYDARTRVTDGNRNQRMAADAAFLPSERDDDNAARGLYPVTRPDGTVGYSVGVGYYERGNPRTSADVDDGRGIPGGLGRNGPRADLEPGFDLQEVRGPNGTVSVYRQNAESKAKQDAYETERQLYRQAAAAGVDPKTFLSQNASSYPALTDGDPRQGLGARLAVQGARQAKAASREDQWRSQMMLAGRNPAKNMVNAFNAMGNPNLTEEQRSSLRYMLPGGQLAATVDANNAAQGGKMAQAAMTAFLTNNPGATPEQRARLQQQLRQGDPAAAGADDIASNNHGSPEALAEYNRLAAAHDTTRGGFSYDDERNLAQTLQKPPYNLKPAEAEAKAYELAQKRRWFSGVRPGSMPPPASGTAPPPAPTPGSDPRAWGGGA